MKNTSLCYIERDGQYLMLHRIKKARDENRDKWIGIGGKFEPGESPEDCVLREVREETGLRLTQVRYCGIITFVSDRWQTEYMHLFHATGFTGTLRECDEGQLEWIEKDRLLALPLIPPGAERIEKSRMRYRSLFRGQTLPAATVWEEGAFIQVGR